jgi:hypothetical protein
VPIDAIWTRSRTVERACYLVGGALIVAGLFHLGVFAVRGGPWYGPVSWRKPTTFGISFGLSLIAIAWVSSYLRLTEKQRTWLLGIFAVDGVVEVGGITIQAWRHVPSHLNTETAFNTAIAMSLAFGGAVLIVVLGMLAVVTLRGRMQAPPSMQLALRAGFVLLLIGLATGAAMIARGEVLINSGSLHTAYNNAGFLKLVHGVTLHAILVLPALAWLLSLTNWSEERRTRTVAFGVAGYGLATIVAFAITLIR